MSYTPLTLYIDTEFFKRNNLRFDTKDLSALTTEFRPQALRLLVPLMMERELKRHFSRRAKECAKLIQEALKTHPFNILPSSVSLSATQTEAECEAELHKQWDAFKSHFKIELLPLAGDLDVVVNWYLSESAPFSEAKKKEFPDAFILSAIDEFQKKNRIRIAVIGNDGDFIRACLSRKHLKHFSRVDDYIDEIKSEIAPRKTSLESTADNLVSTATENLDEIRAIITLGSNATELEIARLITILLQYGESYRYFFNTVTDAFWLPYLYLAGLFRKIPDIQTFPDGRQRYPIWPPAQYLWNVCELDKDTVFKIINELPSTQNPHALNALVATIIKLDHPGSISAFREIIKSFIHENHWGASDNIIKLLNWPQFVASINSAETIALFNYVVEFLPNETGQGEAAPHFESWSYCEILDQGVRSLARQKPYETARLLIDAVARMIRIRHAYDNNETESTYDHSEIWCRRLSGPVENADTDAALAQTLTYACEQLYKNKSEYIQPLDTALSSYGISFFKRLRQHLYSEFPSEQIRPWIREFILSHADYSDWEHHYEFQKMIHSACETFGSLLLTEAELTTIFESILSGPSEKQARENMGEFFTEEGFRRRIDYFHRKQLQPFAPVLFGKYKERYEILAARAAESLTDDDYSPVSVGKSGFVSYRSPRPIEELASLSDEDFLAYINDWEDSRRDSKDWLIEINISALAGAFENVLRKEIFPNPKRSAFWFSNRERIARPIYVRFLLKALNEEVKIGKFDYLGAAFDLCRWVLAKPDELETDDRTDRPHEESRDRPAWSPVRRGVVDFIGGCVNKDAKTPLNCRSDLAALLATVCTQRDQRLDDGRPTILNSRDPLTDAINNPRGIALENVIDLGYWIRRQAPSDPVPEVGRILDLRLGVVDRLPLTPAEYALFGRQFPNLIALNEAWAVANRATLFPRQNEEDWEDAFSTYIRFNNPYRRPFEVLRDDYAYALERFDATTGDEDVRKGWGESLGHHLFMFYLWGIYPLTGAESLLEIFYQKTEAQPKRWAALFDHAGRLLRNTTEDIDKEIKSRIIAFAEWRIAQKNTEELSAYTFWLEAKCLDARWRLMTFSKTLDVASGRDIGTSIKLDSLCKLLPEHVDLIVECFSKLMHGLAQDDYIYIQVDKAKPILQAGLNSANEAVRQQVEAAREQLLKAGHFEFLD